MNAGIGRRAIAELIGTAFLLTAIVGSGIMGERLAGGNLALALLANSLATGGALVALVLALAPISGAHLNPALTMAAAVAGEIRRRDVAPYIAAQIAGAVLGVWLAHLVFELPILQLSAHHRSGLGQWAGEFTATFGLIAIIESGRRRFAAALPAAVPAYIVGAYWFTSSTSFANPAVTLARTLSNTFAGIGPGKRSGIHRRAARRRHRGGRGRQLALPLRRPGATLGSDDNASITGQPACLPRSHWRTALASRRSILRRSAILARMSAR